MACARSRCPLDPVCSQHGLDIVPQRLVDNRRVFSGIGIAFVCYLAAVKTVLEDQIKRPTGEPLAAIFGAVGPRSALALDPGVGKLVPQRVNRLAREIAPIKVFSETSIRPSLLRTTAVKKPRTEWRCQPVAFMTVAMVAPSGSTGRLRATRSP